MFRKIVRYFVSLESLLQHFRAKQLHFFLTNNLELKGGSVIQSNSDDLSYRILYDVLNVTALNNVIRDTQFQISVILKIYIASQNKIYNYTYFGINHSFENTSLYF